MVRYGAKALPEGGWHTVPRVHMDGALIAGDAGGFMNSMRLKGIHLAMRTGMLAAETAFEAVRAGDVVAAKLVALPGARSTRAPVRSELYPVRNVHQAFGHGLLAGLMYSGPGARRPTAGGSRIRCRRTPATSGCEKLAEYYAGQPPSPDQPVAPVKIDRKLTFDRLTNVHYSGTRHTRRSAVAPDRPRHRHLPHAVPRRVRQSVHALLSGRTSTRWWTTAQGGKKLHINASNCVHCKTCDIMDPYQIIDWVPPEGGEGPQYDGM